MTSDRHLALMALMRDIEEPSAVYRRSVRLADSLATESPQWDAAVAKGYAALDDIETAIRAWVDKHPAPVIRDACACRGVAHADDCEVYLELLRTNEPTPEPPMERLAARWEQLAEQGDTAIGHFEGPAAVTLNAEVEERGRVYRQAAADLRESLATGRLPRDLMTRAERAAAPAAVETGE